MTSTSTHHKIAAELLPNVCTFWKPYFYWSRYEVDQISILALYFSLLNQPSSAKMNKVGLACRNIAQKKLFTLL